MSTFVLIHGAWHGGWCWERVAPLLRAAGHAVHTPTLTGLAERADLLNPEVGLETHLADLADLLTGADLREAILVGHSYGGMLITGMAERLPARLGHLIYLDAVAPIGAERSVQELFQRHRPAPGAIWRTTSRRAATAGVSRCRRAKRSSA